jgi:hypothetical protein
MAAVVTPESFRFVIKFMFAPEINLAGSLGKKL